MYYQNIHYRFLFLSILFGFVNCFDTCKLVNTKTVYFDIDFAEDMSRQLPQQYLEQQIIRERENEKIKLQQEKTINDFKMKYDLTLEDKKTNQAKLEKTWLQKAFAFISGARDNLPGFFEVFPELKLKWPIWSKNKSGGMIKCEVDEDCQFPQACCQNPFLLGEKFCCTGLGQRAMVPAYQGQEVLAKRHPN